MCLHISMLAEGKCLIFLCRKKGDTKDLYSRVDRKIYSAFKNKTYRDTYCAFSQALQVSVDRERQRQRRDRDKETDREKGKRSTYFYFIHFIFILNVITYITFIC